MMLHWHGDTFDLPAGAVHLAATADCPQQAFRLGRAFGVQFHPEMDQPTLAAWLASDVAYVEKACGPGGAGAHPRRDARACSPSTPPPAIGCCGT